MASGSTKSRPQSPSANVNLPTGTIYGSNQTYMVQTTGQMFRAAGYEQAIVAYRKGSPVRLGDIAHVYDGIENDRLSATAEVIGEQPHHVAQLLDPEAARDQHRPGR